MKKRLGHLSEHKAAGICAKCHGEEDGVGGLSLVRGGLQEKPKARHTKDPPKATKKNKICETVAQVR